MLTTRSCRVGFLVLSTALFVCANRTSAQFLSLGDNISGEGINSLSGSTTGSSDFASTYNEVYVRTGTRDNTKYERFYTPPHGRHILRISSSGFYYTSSGSHQIIHIELDNGIILSFSVSLKRPEFVPKNSQAWTIESSEVSPTPSDSAEWKKITGDAIYALATPWSSSSPILFVSRDSTKTWQVDTGGMNGAQIQDISLDTAQYPYAATDKGLFSQNPDSNVWHKVTSLTQLTSLNHVFVDRDNRILAAGSSGGLSMSTNNGTSWTAAPTGLGTGLVGLMSDDAYHNLYVTAAPSIFSSSRLYRSAGGTGAWQLVDTSMSRIVGSVSFQNMQINSISGDSALVAGTSFGAFLSTDQGITWTLNNNGIRAENISGMAKTNSGKILLSTDLGIFSNTPPDTVWTKSYPTTGFQGPPFQLNLYSDGLGNIFTLDGEHFPSLLLSNVSGILKSTDGGGTWSADTAGEAAINGRYFYVDETGTQHYGGGGQYSNIKSALWSKPAGGSWAADTIGFPVSTSNYVTAMVSDHNGYLYASGNLSGNRVMRRSMGGGGWSVDTAGIPAAVSSFGLLVSGKNGDVFGFTGQFYGTGIMRRSGGAWSNVSPPPQLSSTYVMSISVDKSGVLFAAFLDNNNVGRGVYFTSNNGSSWTYAGLDSNYVTSLVSFGDSTYALTQDAGAFYVGKNPSNTDVTRSVLNPRSIALFQNYPNPFNPTTAISYQLAAVSKVTLKIYDLLGREIATLVDGSQNAGTHQISFDASRLASGIYFYRLEAGKFTDTKKLVLLK